MTVSWGFSTLLYAGQKYMDPNDAFADGGATGIYEVRTAAIAENGEPVYAVERKLDVAIPGQVVGWISTLCLERDVFLKSRPDIVRLRDNAVVERGRDRVWTPADHRCGPSIAGLQLPIDAEDGDYEIRRVVWAHPFGWFPLRAVMQSVHFRVVGGTKPPT